MTYIFRNKCFVCTESMVTTYLDLIGMNISQRNKKNTRYETFWCLSDTKEFHWSFYIQHRYMRKKYSFIKLNS